jgi:hypothetical protein
MPSGFWIQPRCYEAVTSYQSFAWEGVAAMLQWPYQAVHKILRIGWNTMQIGEFNFVKTKLHLGAMVCRFVDCNMVMRYHWGLGVGHIYSHCSGSPTEVGTGPRASNSTDRSNWGQSQGIEHRMYQTRSCQPPHHIMNLGTFSGCESLRNISDNSNGHNQQRGPKTPDSPINDDSPMHSATGCGKQDEFEELIEPEIYQCTGSGRRRKLTTSKESDKTDSGSYSEYDDEMNRSVLLRDLDPARVMDNNCPEKGQPEEAVENELDGMYSDAEESTSYN